MRLDARLPALALFAALGCTAEPAQVLPDAFVEQPDIRVDEGPPPDVGPLDMAIDMAVDMAPDMAPDMGPAACEFPEGEAVERVVVLHSNDGASAMVPQGQSGGLARFVAVINALQAEARDAEHRLVSLTTGDNLLAGPSFAASLEQGAPYFDAVGLSAAGFDAMAVGNHDFDFGPEVFVDFVRSFDQVIEAHGDAREGLTAPLVLGANLRTDGEPLVEALRTEERLVQFAELDGIGLIGVSTPEIEQISSPGAVTVDAPRGAVEAAVATLRERGVRFVILVSHLRDIELESRLAAEIAGIDVVIAGSTDDLLAADDALVHSGDRIAGPYPRIVCGPDGQPVPLVSTGGAYRYVGRLVVDINEDGRVIAVDPVSGPVRVSAVGLDAVEPDPFVEAQVTVPVQAALNAFADNEVALSSVELDGRRVNLRAGETNLGSLIADALLWEVEEFVFGTESPVPDIALINAGAIRNNTVLPPGSITELDTFAMLPFASFVVETTVTRAELKAILENGVSQVESGSGRFLQVAGMRFTWNPDGRARRVGLDGSVIEPGNRITQAELLDGTVVIRDGQPVEGPDLVVATLDFLSRGGDGFPFATAGVGFGVSYQQALRDFVAGGLEGEITGARYPAGGLGRIVRQQ